MSHCIFCDILAGQADGSFVYRDDLCTAFMDIHQPTAGKLLVVPNQHAASLADLPPETGGRMFQEAQRLAAAFAGPVAPIVVASGPVQEVTVAGDAVDLLELPVPQWHKGDGGRYLNTWCGVVTQGPEGGALNVGLYRGQVVARNRIAVKLDPAKGWGKHFAAWRERGAAMPVAVFYGAHPALTLMAGCPLPEPPEYDVAGGVMGGPVELVRCGTSGLLVPAQAEIVVEGRISTDPADFVEEGPFGEWTGHYSVAMRYPVIEVARVMHRADPILTGCLACTASAVPRESSVTGHLVQAAMVWHALAGFEGVVDVETSPRRASPLVIVKIEKREARQPRRVADALWGSQTLKGTGSAVLVVNGDVEVRDLSSVLNHLSRLQYFRRPVRVSVAGADAAVRGAGPGELAAALFSG